MNGISRIELFSEIINLLDTEQQGGKWIKDIVGEMFLDDYKYLLKINIGILMDIESNYLVQSDYEQEIFTKEKLLTVYMDNVNLLERDLRENHFKKLNLDYRKIQESKDEVYAFNALLKILNDINNRVINGSEFNLYKYYAENKFRFNNNEENGLKTPINRVFLSHAFDDHLYTFSLFLFMLKNQVFLYVDWLFCKPLNNGIEIKKNLENELALASQLLFLRTVNSEFSIKGSGNIRGWCSWELGSFYTKSKTKNSKFYIELYSRKDTKLNNKQLDGISPLREINMGILK
ncbi:TPA: hypothetical protein ACGO26_000716 [Streptococcus suis]|jgi:hypothetical protein